VHKRPAVQDCTAGDVQNHGAAAVSRLLPEVAMRLPPARRRALVVACFSALLVSPVAGPAEAVRYKLANTFDADPSNYSFGRAMVEGGGRIFIAAPLDHGPFVNAIPGAVYVYDAHTGALIRTLRSPVPGGTAFGAALALVGDTLAVGEPATTYVPGSSQEFVHLFDAPSGNLLRSIPNPNPELFAFGSALAPFDGGAQLAVAAPHTGANSASPGAVLAFDLPSGDPAAGYEQPSENTNNQGFGHALASVGGLMVVGNPAQRPDNDIAGVAFVYDALAGTFLRTLDNPEPILTAFFGQAMAPVGGAIVIGAPTFGLRPTTAAAFVIDPATGALLQTLHPPGPTSAAMSFGVSLAAVGDLVLVGGTSSALASQPSGVFLFDPVSGADVWDYFTHSIVGFGEWVASDGRDLLVSGSGTDGIHAMVFHFVPTCGDGVLDPCETCDDGNNVSGDGCSADCVLETCGNGVVDPGEQCDDGNDVDGDGCDRGCLATGCGNCIVDPGEECDDGNAASEDHCDPNCTLPRCGNGFVGFGETCDDGNALGGDGCSATCQPEACGNGVVDAGESCDDGNQVSGDGCDAHCRLETGRLGWWKPTFAIPDVTKVNLAGEPLLTPSGVLMAVDTQDLESRVVQLFDPATGALLHTFPETNVSTTAGFDGDIWIADTSPDVVHRYDGVTFALKQSYGNPDPEPPFGFGYALGRAGDALLVRNAGHAIVDVFDAASGDFLRALTPPAGVSDDAFGAKIVAVGSHAAITGTGVVYLFDPATGTLVQTLDGGALNTFDAAGPVALDGDVLVPAPGVVNLFDGADGTLLHTFMPPGGSDASFGRYIALAGGSLLISGTNLGNDVVHVFDPTTHAFVRTLRNPLAGGGCFGDSIVDTPFGIAISNLCAGEDLDGIVHVFDPDTGRLVAALPNERSGDSESQTHALFDDGTTLFLWHQDDEDGAFAVARAWVPCDDGVLEPGEECDDGNLVSGDGCDLNCTLTRCGNGIVTAGEECDDGNRAAEDGCENDCTVTREVCPAPLTLQRVDLALRHVGAPAGNETLTLTGALVPPAGTKLDPRDAAKYGAQVRILDADGTALLDLSLATAIIPPGNRGDACGHGDGWRSGKGRVVYTNDSGALDAQCTPGSAQGLRRLELTRRAADGGLAFRLRAGPSPIVDPVGTLRVAIAFGGAAGPSAACGARTFDDVACERSMRGATIDCH
jgi:cysteine-rich repeat protein